MSLSGHVAELALADLLQFHTTNMRTSQILVRSATTDGEVYCADGSVVHARYGDLFGNEALFALLVEDELTYDVNNGVRTHARTVFGDIKQLLLEAAVREDEGSLPRPHPRPPVAPQPDVPHRRRMAWALGLGTVAGVVIAAGAFALWNGGDAERSRGPKDGLIRSAAADPIDATHLTGAGDAPPTLLASVPPVAPNVDLALAPTIVCRVLVDEDGRVAQARVYRSRLELAAFEEAALDAVARYRFRPALDDGKPVAAWVNWPVSFSGAKRAAPSVVSIKGSDTIGGALAPALAAAFSDTEPRIHVTVEALGSSTAFAGLFDGSADIGASSRPIKAKELDDARRLGVALQEFVIGYDGIAIITHPDNPVRSLTLEQASQVFGGEVTHWSQVGGPDAPIRRLSRPSYSGTHSFFKDKVLRLGNRSSERQFAPDTEIVEHNEDIVAAVAADPTAVSYVGLGWTSDDVRVLALAPGADQPPVLPGLETVQDGSYPVYRPLLMYTRGAPSGDVAALLAFIVSDAGQRIVAEHGFVRAPANTAAIPIGGDEVGARAPQVTRVYFRLASARLDANALHALSGVADKLRAGTHRAVVTGNADAVGSGTDNQQLASRRAAAVAAYFKAAGAPATSVEVASSSADRPMASNETRAGRSENRRVDVFVIPLQ